MMDDYSEELLDRARENAVAAESDAAIAIVTAIAALTNEIANLRTTLERHQP